MKDDYTTNSHSLTHTFIFRKVGRMFLLNVGVKGLKKVTRSSEAHLTSINTSCQNVSAFVILCSNHWLKIGVTARQKSTFPQFRCTVVTLVFHCLGAITLVVAHPDVVGAVDWQLQVVQAQPVDVCVVVGEQATLKEWQNTTELLIMPVNYYLIKHLSNSMQDS